MSKSVRSNLMGLIPVEQFPIKLPISGKEIIVKPFTHGQLAPSLRVFDEMKENQSGAFKKSLLSMKNLVAGCIVPEENGENIEVDAMEIGDFSYLINYLKEISRGKKNTFHFSCSKKDCGYVQAIEFVKEDCQITNLDNRDLKTAEIVLGDKKIVFHMKPYTFQIMYKNASFVEGSLSEGDEITTFYASLIDAIEEGDNIYDSLGEALKIEFLNKLKISDLQPVADYLEGRPNIIWEGKFECPTCGKKSKYKMDKPTDFFG